MSIEHTCPSCHIRLRVADESAGKKVRCKCGAISAVPATPQAAQQPGAGSTTAASPHGSSAAGKSNTGGAGQSLILTCSSCQQTLRAPQSAAGKAVRCKCGQIIQIPAAAVPAAAAAPRASSAPGVSAATKPAAAAATAVASRPVAPARVASAAVAAPVRAPAQPATPVGSIFDELTEADWHRESPIKRAYAPPAASKDGAVLKQYAGAEVKAATEKGSIPATLIILSVLNFIGSAIHLFAGVAVVVLVQVAAVMEQLEAVFPAIRVAAAFFCVYLVGWGIYLSVVGVGLLQRAPWGWCVAGVAYAHSLVDKLYTVFSSLMEEGGPSPRLGGMIGGMLIAIGITSYIYKAETRSRFGIKTLTPVIICATIGVVMAIASIAVIVMLTQSAEAMIPADADAG